MKQILTVILCAILGFGAAFAGSNPDSDYLVAFKDKKTKLYGYRDARTGQTVIEPQYKEASLMFNEGRAVVSHMNGKKAVKKSYDIIRPDGSVVLNIQSDYIPSGYGEDGWLWHEKGKVRFDTLGKAQPYPDRFVRFAEYDVLDTHPGMVRAVAWREKNKPMSEMSNLVYGYIDPTNLQIIIPFDYDVLGEFVDGLAIYRQGKETGLLDTNGKKVHIFPEKYFHNFPIQTLALDIYGVHHYDNNEYRVVNSYFNDNRLWIIPSETDEKGKLKNGSRWVAIDRDFKEVVNPEDPIRTVYCSFKDGVAPVSFGNEIKDKKWWGKAFTTVYIDTLGNIVSPESYLYCTPFQDYGNGVKRARIDIGKINSPSYGYIDRDFNQVVPAIYSVLDETIRRFDDGSLYARAKTKNYYGIIDENNNVIIPFKYDFIGAFKNDKAYAERKVNGETKVFIIDRGGNELMLDNSKTKLEYRSNTLYGDRELIRFYDTRYPDADIVIDIITGKVVNEPQ